MILKNWRSKIEDQDHLKRSPLVIFTPKRSRSPLVILKIKIKDHDPCPSLLWTIVTGQYMMCENQATVQGLLRHILCGFSMTEQVRLCAVWPMENWLVYSLNQIQCWTTVRESYSRPLERGPLKKSCRKMRPFSQLQLCINPSIFLKGWVCPNRGSATPS